MIISFVEKSWEDYNQWMIDDKKIFKKIQRLIKETLRDPFGGIGKPEPLKYLGAGVWSRRITQEHRLVYVIGADRIDFVQARYHYQD